MGLFVKVGTTQELEALEAGKLVEVTGQRIAIFNLGGKYWAIEDMCCIVFSERPVLPASPPAFRRRIVTRRLSG